MHRSINKKRYQVSTPLQRTLRLKLSKISGTGKGDLNDWESYDDPEVREFHRVRVLIDSRKNDPVRIEREKERVGRILREYEKDKLDFKMFDERKEKEYKALRAQDVRDKKAGRPINTNPYFIDERPIMTRVVRTTTPKDPTVRAVVPKEPEIRRPAIAEKEEKDDEDDEYADFDENDDFDTMIEKAEKAEKEREKNVVIQRPDIQEEDIQRPISPDRKEGTKTENKQPDQPPLPPKEKKERKKRKTKEEKYEYPPDDMTKPFLRDPEDPTKIIDNPLYTNTSVSPEFKEEMKKLYDVLYDYYFNKEYRYVIGDNKNPTEAQRARISDADATDYVQLLTNIEKRRILGFPDERTGEPIEPFDLESTIEYIIGGIPDAPYFDSKPNPNYRGPVPWLNQDDDYDFYSSFGYLDSDFEEAIYDDDKEAVKFKKSERNRLKNITLDNIVMIRERDKKRRQKEKEEGKYDAPEDEEDPFDKRERIRKENKDRRDRKKAGKDSKDGKEKKQSKRKFLTMKESNEERKKKEAKEQKRIARREAKETKEKKRAERKERKGEPAVNRWHIHVKAYREANPGISYKQALQDAKATYVPTRAPARARGDRKIGVEQFVENILEKAGEDRPIRANPLARWQAHVKAYKLANPGITHKQAVKDAKASYTRT